MVLAGLDLGFEHVVMARIYLTHRRCPDRSGARQRRQAAWICRNKRPRALQRCSVVGISRISSRASPPTGPVRPMLPEASALEFSMEGREEVYARQAEARITLQKLPRLKDGSLSARTSAFTLPNVVSGLCLMPS